MNTYGLYVQWVIWGLSTSDAEIGVRKPSLPRGGRIPLRPASTSRFLHQGDNGQACVRVLENAMEEPAQGLWSPHGIPLPVACRATIRTLRNSDAQQFASGSPLNHLLLTPRTIRGLTATASHQPPCLSLEPQFSKSEELTA